MQKLVQLFELLQISFLLADFFKYSSIVTFELDRRLTNKENESNIILPVA